MSPGKQRTLTGSVLMNSPTIDSASGNSAGRPETVAPKTTSSRPVRFASRTAQAPCTTVLTVTPSSAAIRPTSCGRVNGTPT